MSQVLVQNQSSVADALSKNVYEAMDRACRRIAPVWPLDSFVAVNPFMGYSDHRFEEVSAILANATGGRMTMPVDYYLNALDCGQIALQDVQTALKEFDAPHADAPQEFLSAVRTDAKDEQPSAKVPTVTQLASQLSGKDWEELTKDRVSSWAAAYFDQGEALWKSTDSADSVYFAWKFEAEIDRTPEIMGLKGFRAAIQSLPDSPRAAAKEILDRLAPIEQGRELYYYRLLMQVSGWAGYAAKIVWDHELNGTENDTLFEFLVVMLAWEYGVYCSLQNSELPQLWTESQSRLAELSSSPAIEKVRQDELILQTAFDHAEHRRTLSLVNRDESDLPAKTERPEAQAVFCIDVRSEVYRRHIETVNPHVETFGFAGFFGFPIEYVPIGHTQGSAQCPVLLKPGFTILESMPSEEE